MALCMPLASPLAAQTVVADAPNAAANVPLIVPALPGKAYPATIGPSRRGVVGRPRSFARVRVTLMVEPACSVRAVSTEPLLIRCSGGTPYLAEFGSNDDLERALPSAFAPDSPTPVTQIAITARRLTVEY